MCKNLFEYLFLILLGSYINVEYLGHTGILSLTVWETVKMFSTAVASLHIPTGNLYQDSNFSTP